MVQFLAGSDSGGEAGFTSALECHGATRALWIAAAGEN
jgi:hypothetical protein